MSSLQDVLAGLQKSYLASMPEKISNLQTLWDSKDFVRLETEYHKLKGTGRTYGLPEVTVVGAALEKICQKNLDSLVNAVPLSFLILAKIKDAREKGPVFDLDNDPDYTRLTQLVQEAEAKAG